MGKPHTGNHGSHKWTKARHATMYFENGGRYFAIAAVGIVGAWLGATLYIVRGVFDGW